MLTFEKLKAVAARNAPDSNIRSIILGLQYAEQAHLGLHLPHRYIQYAAQVAHESGRFRYDEEVWGKDGGTAAQKKYDIRTDLGNTPERDGDGFLFRGRTGLQATGRANYIAFRDWCKAKGFKNVPDFEKNPDAINTDPWEGLFPIYYWDNRKLNRYADEGNNEMITKRINGGLNGFDDRLDLYTDLALLELGFPATKEGLKAFQRQAQAAGRLPKDQPGKPTQIDGVQGPKTRSALHMALVDLGKQESPVLPLPEGEPMPEIKPAPVTEEKEVEVEVPVVPEKADKTLLQRIAGAFAIFAPLLAWFADRFAGLDQTGQLILLGIGVGAVGVLLWRGERIAAKARSILDAWGA